MAEAEVEEAIIREYQESERSIIRDRIVILGRQGAGKTVYLSLLYDLLWRSKGDLLLFEKLKERSTISRNYGYETRWNNQTIGAAAAVSACCSWWITE